MDFQEFFAAFRKIVINYNGKDHADRRSTTDVPNVKQCNDHETFRELELVNAGILESAKRRMKF